MSLDYKLMFAWHISMMFLFISGRALTTSQELEVAVILMVILVSLSMRNRRARNWHWQGTEPKQVFFVAGGIVLTAIFLYAATPQFPLSNPAFFPWYMAGLGIGVMNALAGLRLVCWSETEFAADCGSNAAAAVQATESQATQSQPEEPPWHGILRGIYTTVFFCVWFTFIVFFYVSGKTFRDGSPVPTPTQTAPMTEHGKTVYVTPEQKALCDLLMMISMMGMPSVILAGPILHFLVGVKLYPNTPTLKEYMARKSANSVG